MGLLFRNWLEEGFYEEDSLGDLTRLYKTEDILDAYNNNCLYQHDGLGLSKVNNINEVIKNNND